MSGILIDIEGLDGSGKETQSKLLLDYLNSKDPESAVCVSFPDYESDSSKLVKMYLNGEYGEDPMLVSPYAVSSFFAVDRFSSYKKKWQRDYEEGKWIIANRYTSSNSIYQMSKLGRDCWEEYLSWLYDYEYNKLKLPKPSLVIYLDTPVEISQKLMDKRYKGDQSMKDLHESCENYLKLCEKSAKYAALRDGWTVLNCVEENNLKTIENIHREIISIVEGIRLKKLKKSRI